MRPRGRMHFRLSDWWRSSAPQRALAEQVARDAWRSFIGGPVWRGSGGRRRRRRAGRVDPAGTDPAVEAVGRLGVDAVGMQDQAAERRLDMTGRAAEAVIEIEVAKRRLDVVAPQ